MNSLIRMYRSSQIMINLIRVNMVTQHENSLHFYVGNHMCAKVPFSDENEAINEYHNIHETLNQYYTSQKAITEKLDIIAAGIEYKNIH